MSHYRQRKGLPSPRISGPALASVIARYQAGETAKEIAASLGEPRAYVAILLSRNGIRRDLPPLLTDERKDDLVRRYAAGERTDALAVEFGIPRPHVARWAREAGVRRYRRMTDHERNAAVEAYASGQRTGLIAPGLGVSGGAVRFWAKRAGHEARTSRRVPVNDAAFDELTPMARYWIGFLLADGCIKKDNSVVTLALAGFDSEHVEKFRAFCGSQHALTHIASRGHKTPGPMLSVSVWSRKICAVLSQHGIVPRKTGKESASEQLAFDRDFWRGVIDGDGTMGLYSFGSNAQGKQRPITAKLSICGSEALLCQFTAFVETVIPGNKTRPSQRGNLWIMAVNSYAAVSMIRYLYEDACEALERKSAKAKEILGLYAAR